MLYVLQMCTFFSSKIFFLTEFLSLKDFNEIHYLPMDIQL